MFECWSDDLIRVTPLLRSSIAAELLLAEVWQNLTRFYPLLGLGSGYALVMLFNPVRRALGDGFRCIGRYRRIWISFALLGFGYFAFQFATFTPIQNWADLDPNQIISLSHWYWPRFTEVWRETPLPALEGVAGLFDNATTTYPLSVVAAVFMLINWRGLHGALVRALWKRYRWWGHLIYLILLLSALASLLKLVPVSQVLFGTDFPFRTSADQVNGLIEYGFSAGDLRAIDHDNALRLLPRRKR